jgi:hypothetical protein
MPLDRIVLHGMQAAKPTVLQTAGKGTFICGNACSCANFASYSPGA